MGVLGALYNVYNGKEQLSRERQATKVFQHLDHNSDGLISYTDLTAMYQTLFPKDIAELDQLYASFPRNKQGDISVEDFVNGVLCSMEDLSKAEFRTWYELSTDKKLVRRHRVDSLLAANIPVPDGYIPGTMSVQERLFSCCLSPPVDEDVKEFRVAKAHKKRNRKKERLSILRRRISVDSKVHATISQTVEEELGRVQRNGRNTLVQKQFDVKLSKLQRDAQSHAKVHPDGNGPNMRLAHLQPISRDKLVMHPRSPKHKTKHS